MPRKNRKNVSQMKRAHSDEEESVEGNTDGDAGELQANAAVAHLQTMLQELRVSP